MDLDVGEATAVSFVRPFEALVPGLPVVLPDGLNGEVVGIRACLAHAGVDVSTPTLLGVSGAAFRALFLRRADNPGEGPDWCWSSDHVSARDTHAEIARYVGASIEAKLKLEPEAAWNLIEMETSAGRPLVSFGVGGPLEPVIVTGYRRSLDRRRFVRVQSKFLAARDAEVEVTGRSNWCGDEAPLKNPLIVVQVVPGLAPDAARKAALKIEACRWAIVHGAAGKERAANQLLYRAGLGAFEAFADFLGTDSGGIGPSLAEHGEAEEVATFVAVIATEWTRARRAAALFLEEWAFRDEELGPPSLPLAGGAAGLRAAAARYRETASTLERFFAAVPPPWGHGGLSASIAALRDAPRRLQAAGAIREARDREQESLEALEAAIVTH